MSFTEIILFGSGAGLATVGGTYLVFSAEAWCRRNRSLLISFAAGFMLATAFIHLVPESFELAAHNAPLGVLGGMLAFYIIQAGIMLHPCHDEQCEIHRLGTIAFVGLTFHSLLDGAVIVVGFAAEHGLGVMTALAVIFHEVTEGISTTGLLLASGRTRIKVVICSMVVALATPLGAIGGYFFLSRVPGDILGILLAVAGGSFIYIAAADLLPETHKGRVRLNTAVLILGVAVVWMLSATLHVHVN